MVKTRSLSRLFMGIVLAAFLFISLPAPLTEAQTEGVDPSEPVNLSQSGGTLDPIATVDSTGVIHVAWRDSDDRFFYSRTTREGWTEPRWIDYPFRITSPIFDAPAPRLVTGLSGRLTMFWLNEIDTLRSSAISAENFGTTAAWSRPVPISRSVEAYDIEVDDRGFYHLVYLQAADYPPANAGIYYTASRDYGVSWDIPTLIYNSSYFIRREDNANGTKNTVDLAVSTVDGKTAVYVTFDNVARKRVIFARSMVDGLRWEEPVEIDGPATQGSSTTPFQLRVSGTKENVVMAWQVGQPGGVCTNYYMISRDAGETWSERQRFNVPYLECAEEKTLEVVSGDYTLLTDTIKGQLYFSAWNSKEWSQAQARPELFEFIDPETLNKTRLGCQVPVLLPTLELAFVGCDQEEGRDIWLVRQPLADIASWFADVAGWRVVERFQTTQNHIANLQITADNQNGIHALWNQVEDPGVVAEGSEVTSLANDAIYYSYWNGSTWAKPRPIYSGMEDSVGRMAVEVSEAGRIGLVWKDQVARNLLYSWAEADLAGSALEWATPSILPVEVTTVDMPAIDIAPSGTVFVVYALPVNENRGVYLTLSTDEGKSWTDTIKILDGVGSGLEVVETPLLTIGQDGTMHILVGDGMINSTGGLNRLLYLKSSDGGSSWTLPETISTKQVKHYKVLTTGKSTVHRIWQEEGQEGDGIYHQLSIDGGSTWSRTVRVLSSTDKFWLGDVVTDAAGQLHLFQTFSDLQQYQNVRYWLWDGGDWSEVDNFVTGQTALEGEVELASTISRTGELMTVTLRGVTDLSTQIQYNMLMYTGRQIQIPADEVNPIVLMPVMTATPAIQIVQTATPQATATSDLSALTNPPAEDSGMGTVVGVSIVASTLVIGLALGFVFIRAKKNQ